MKKEKPLPSIEKPIGERGCFVKSLDFKGFWAKNKDANSIKISVLIWSE